MIIIRPIIIILVFFTALFVLKGPIRHIDENLAIVNQIYINPLVNYIREKIIHTFSNPKDVIEDDEGKFVLKNIATSSMISEFTTTSTSALLYTEKAGAKSVLMSKDLSQTVDSSRLSIQGILQQTNMERSTRKFGLLRLNTKLNTAAEQKLQDMFTNQYFQHISPSGVKVADVIRNADYEYIVIGENLALGNFGGDILVVTAWMNSPGHRANILDARFSEIGIAVGKGIYNEKEQWIAVQHFAKPLSSCTGPRVDLKLNIDKHTGELSQKEIAFNALKAKIEVIEIFSTGYGSLAEQYNALVSEYNTRLESLKDEIAVYNLEVRKFNICAGIINP